MHKMEGRALKLAQAILHSSVVVVVVYALLLLVTGSLFNLISLISLLFAFFIAIFCVVVFGVPFHFLMLKMRIENFYPYIVVGFVIPAIFVAINKPFGEDGFLWVSWQAFLLGVFGSACAFIFWKKAK